MSFDAGSTSVGTMGNVPTELVGSATLAYVAVIASLFLMPVMVPVNSGLASPYRRLAFAAVTDRGAGLTVSVPLLEVTV